MGQKRKTLVKVRNHHIDSYGHVNNAQYFTYLEDARTDFFEELGFSLEVLHQRKIQVYLTDVTMRYKHPAKLNDVLEVYGWFIEITNRKATWGHEIYETHSKKLILTGTATGMFLENGRLVVIPRDIREAMQSLLIPPAKNTS